MQNHQNELIKEEVTAENISEVIAKWTGIPVTKLLQSEREIIKSGNRTSSKSCRTGRSHSGCCRCYQKKQSRIK
jgi:ATP-dependent Clp protease ATP-binding subunit ClpA